MIALLIVASIWYLVLTTVASVGQYFLERRFSRGFGTTVPGTLRGRDRPQPAVQRERAMTAPMVRCRQVRKSFGRLEVLRGIDLAVERGEVVCVVGPSGSGKSTLLRCVNHLEEHQAGADLRSTAT